MNPPVGKGGILWTRFYEQSRTTGDPLMAEKMADSMLRVRERALAIKASRAHVIIIAPIMHTQVVAPPTVCTCKAKTMSGKACGFRAVTPGGFCKKHAVTTKNF